MTFLHKHMYQVTLLWLYLRISRDFVSRKYTLTAISITLLAQQARKQEKTPPEIKGCFTYVVTEIVEQLDLLVYRQRAL